MDYAQTLAFLYERLPAFQRIGPAAYRADLGNISVLCAHLHHPEKKFKSIHIAGTNGKGSVAHMMASILQESGLKVGLHTSPHLKDFRERILVNGMKIPTQEVVDFVAGILPVIEEIQPSFFELTVAMAFDHFAREKVDVAVVETGMGGRFDSTNILLPELSVITNIGMDHTAFLGDTLEAIAGEKAGIIKKEVPVVIGETQTETTAVFQKKADDMQAAICWADQEWRSQKIPADESGRWRMLLQRYGETAWEVEPALQGNYQLKNVTTVVCAMELLRKKGWPLTHLTIAEGIRNVGRNTHLMGRWQRIGSGNPIVIADAMHNADGVKASLSQLEEMNYTRLHIVLGVVGDKAPEPVLRLLPKTACYYFCKADLPRAMEARLLQEKAHDTGLSGDIYPSCIAAYEAALNTASSDDLVLIGGSIFVIAEVLPEE
ncbi:MAG: bifunctional folylpolyglutamate synthase/dihydrofolate synthase [Flavobacteriales bacterium]|nr:bifunctional folylpolyglutamate synthase/dihydrofolate synthase [Flavobacteriales bacterium]